ncbi:hypothetical protein [Erwinia mallotivora]|uniref:hypothetical protein n=1 Tax=Erwinia mallotivora TaxID=69222 RepID=UPI0021C119C3|nr:hypothetical protein [Erwinia mallotivora]
MGSAKEHLYDIQENRFEAWAAEHHPDAEPDTPDWHAIREEYYEWQEWLYEQGYEAYVFTASLNSVHERCEHAFSELVQLSELNSTYQPGIVLRMAWVHAVSVMEACLMYCARALINHEPHLALFRKNYVEIGLRKKAREKLEQAASPDASDKTKPPGDTFRAAAQKAVGRMTFHNVDQIRRYFDLMLKSKPDWPVDPLNEVIETRQDLVHRNGVTSTDTEVVISSYELAKALKIIHDFLVSFRETMRAESAGYEEDDDEF